MFQPPRGFALYVIMMILLMISLVVLATQQSGNTALHISANTADRELAHARAESALRDAERYVRQRLQRASAQAGKIQQNSAADPCRKQSKNDFAVHHIGSIGSGDRTSHYFQIQATGCGKQRHTRVNLQSHLEISP